MALGKTWQRWMRHWRLERRRVPAVQPQPDPADCGTAWGLELTVPKQPPVQRSARDR